MKSEMIAVLRRVHVIANCEGDGPLVEHALSVADEVQGGKRASETARWEVACCIMRQLGGEAAASTPLRDSQDGVWSDRMVEAAHLLIEANALG